MQYQSCKHTHTHTHIDGHTPLGSPIPFQPFHSITKLCAYDKYEMAKKYNIRSKSTTCDMQSAPKIDE